VFAGVVILMEKLNALETGRGLPATPFPACPVPAQGQVLQPAKTRREADHWIKKTRKPTGCQARLVMDAEKTLRHPPENGIVWRINTP
jgi:hypothetical protein